MKVGRVACSRLNERYLRAVQRKRRRNRDRASRGNCVDVVRPQDGSSSAIISCRWSGAVAHSGAPGGTAIEVVEGNNIGLRRAAIYIDWKNDEIGGTTWRRIDVKTELCWKLGWGRGARAETDAPVALDLVAAGHAKIESRCLKIGSDRPCR